MSDLDNKLRTIIKLAYIKGTNDGKDAKREEQVMSDAAEVIKRVFVDEGWRFDPLTTQNIAVREDGTIYPADPRSNLMTGKEWYKRFKRGLLGYFDEGGDFPKYLNGYKTIEVLGVAARASGIEDE
jgi:hypothetical protein